MPKLTDEQIIRAFTLCETHCNRYCNVDCPYFCTSLCKDKIKMHVLDLINRLKASKEYYKNSRDKYVDKVMFIAKQCDELQEENNRLKADNEKTECTLLGVMHFVDKWLDGDELEQDEVKRADTAREKALRIVETAKTEAYQEFAERLKKRIFEDDSYTGWECVYPEEIDNLLKEMVGD